MELKEENKQLSDDFIPEDWTVKEIGDEIDLLTGFPFPSNKYSESGIKLLRGSNVKRGSTDWSHEITQYWEKLTPDLKPYELVEGDIVIAMDGSLVGKSYARLSKKDLPALLLQRVARIRSNKIDLGYLKEYVCSAYFTKHCESVKTVSAIPHISPKDIRSFRIPLPPSIEEQTAIATALSDTDALIESLEKLIEKKRNIKQGVMQELLTPKERWKHIRLGDTLEFQVGYPFSSEYFNPNVGVRLIKNRDLKSNDSIIFYNHSYNQDFIVQNGDILIGMDGDFIPCKWSQGKALLNQRVGRLMPKKSISLDFLYYYIQKPLKEIEKRTSSTTVKHLSHRDIEDLVLPLPELIEQTDIAQALTAIDNELFALEQKKSNTI
jgi:type I restriction enzyme, S subunit